MQISNQSFALLVARFGRKSGSHLFPLFNYLFVPQTVSQYSKWANENKKGIHNQNLVMYERDLPLIKDFFPSAEFKPTKSGQFFRIVNFADFQMAVKNQLASN